jgi:hypothetical protein
VKRLYTIPDIAFRFLGLAAIPLGVVALATIKNYLYPKPAPFKAVLMMIHDSLPEDNQSIAAPFKAVFLIGGIIVRLVHPLLQPLPLRPPFQVHLPPVPLWDVPFHVTPIEELLPLFPFLPLAVPAVSRLRRAL